MTPDPAASEAVDTLHSFHIDLDQATPMMRQFIEVKRQHPGTLLFYRMGDFYETFLEDALIAARVLEITLTGRDAGALGRVPMAGVPVKAVEGYLARLLAKNFKVAICEQIEDPATAKGLVARKVVRVLSPGTVTEAALLRADENNFLAAIAPGKRPQNDPWGLAWCDVTTGEFYVAMVPWARLPAELDRLQPSEVLTPGRLKKARPGEGVDEWVSDAPCELQEAFRCTAMPAHAYDMAQTTPTLQRLLNVATLEGFGLDDEAGAARRAAGVIAQYLHETFIDDPPVFERIQRIHPEQAVAMAQATRRHLELMNTAKQGRAEGSLYWALNRTATAMGARLLRQWIARPLTDLNAIHRRLDGVDALTQQPAIRETLRRLLPSIYDLERLSIRVANLSAMPRDLVALKQSLAILPEIATLLVPLTCEAMACLHTVAPEVLTVMARIDAAVADTPPAGLKEGGVIKPGHHGELDAMRQTLEGHQEWLAAYEQEQRDASGIKTLKVAHNHAFGYYIEISRAQAAHAPATYHRKQTLTNAERFTTEALQAYESRYLDALGQRQDLEYRLFVDLRQALQPFAPLLLDVAQRVATLDVLQSLALVAVEQGYVRPIVDDSHALTIQDGRHPVVEKMLPMGRFTPNACTLSAEKAAAQHGVPQILIITGPNMAGKSTYMRQVAMIVLMAQMGAFVPASYARIGLVDAIYTRIGAVDDLASGQSTFMVEMNETAQILNGATARSLVLLDEVGRGTSTIDGVAIAWSVVEFLADELGCRTLFATHLHELNALQATRAQVQNARVCVIERETPSGPEIEFLHQVEPGSAQKSYGIQVARMAGVPARVIRRAGQLLEALQAREARAMPRSSLSTSLEAVEPSPQLSLF